MLNQRERAGIIVLLFIVKILNPTKYEHQIGELKTELLAQLKEAK